MTDEQLSAFLDQELSEAEMSLIRDALVADSSLADRLVELATVDSFVKQQAASVDAVPMSASLQQLLAGLPGEDRKVVFVNAWVAGRQQVSRFISRHAAMAAGVALFLGFFGGQIFTAGAPTSGFDLNPHLSAAASGQAIEIDAQTSLLARFSFVDQQSRFCRQYQLQSADSVTENVACHNGSDWKVVATAYSSSLYAPAQAEEYRVASGTSLLDSTLDIMMQGDALSREQEAAAINAGWKP